MDSDTPRQTVSSYENTPSTSNLNVRLEEDNVLAIPNVTEIKKPNDINAATEREQLTNTRPISKSATTYELETFEDKLLIIFYHEEVKGFKPRIATEKELLKDTFKKFNFTIEEHKDCTKAEIFRILDDYTNLSKDLSKYGCVAVAVITFGTDDEQLRAKDMPYRAPEIYARVVNGNRTLITKPKVIIIEAFRGEELNPKKEPTGATVRDGVKSYTLPEGSDSLIFYSHYACTLLERLHVTTNEPWVIRVLCEKINRHAYELDLESIMTKVNESDYTKHPYSPAQRSTLLRSLHLRYFGDKPPSVQFFTDDKSKNELSYHFITLDPISSFEYMYFDFAITCLKYYIEEKRDDQVAIDLLEQSITSEDIVRISKLILDYLMKNAQDCQCFKQMHVLENEKGNEK